MLSHCPGQVDFPSGQVTYQPHLSNWQEINQVICQLNWKSKLRLSQGKKIWELPVPRASWIQVFWALKLSLFIKLKQLHSQVFEWSVGPVLVAAWALPQDVLVQAGYAHSAETWKMVSDPVPACLQDHELVLGPYHPLSGWDPLHLLAAVVQAHPEVEPDGCLLHVEPVRHLAFLAYLGVAPAAESAWAASEDGLAAFGVWRMGAVQPLTVKITSVQLELKLLSLDTFNSRLQNSSGKMNFLFPVKCPPKNQLASIFLLNCVDSYSGATSEYPTTLFTCASVLWRMSNITTVVIVIRWDANKWTGILKRSPYSLL